MKVNIFIFIVFTVIITIYKNQASEIKYVDGLNFQLELFSNEYRYYNFCNALYDYRKPFGYVKVHSEHEIRDVMLYAKSIGKTVSVRSGGHSFTSLSILNDTINLDMSGMKGIEINFDEKTVTAQGGVLMGDLFEELLKHGLISTGGTNPGIGMGIALSGGSGFLGSKYGYLIDSIIEHTVVLANGHIVKANKHNEYSDLHWALLGAGNGGFGVVTDFKIKVHDAQPLYYHNQIIIQQEELVEATLILNEFVESLTEKQQKSMHCFIMGVLTNNLNHYELNFFFMDGPTCQGNIQFNKLLILIQQKVPNAIPTKGNKNEKTFMELVNVTPGVIHVPSFTFGFGRFCLLNNQTANIALSITNEIKKKMKKIQNDKESFCLIQVNYNGGEQTNVELKKTTSFIHRGSENKWVIGLYCSYFNAENNNEFNDFRNYLNENLDSLSTRIYANIPENVDNWQTKTYGDNYPILQEIKLKYDPSNYFNYPQSIELPKTPSTC